MLFFNEVSILITVNIQKCCTYDRDIENAVKDKQVLKISRGLKAVKSCRGCQKCYYCTELWIVNSKLEIQG